MAHAEPSRVQKWFVIALAVAAMLWSAYVIYAAVATAISFGDDIE